MTYEQVRADLCEMYPGWTFDTVDNMTFEQIDSACRRGRREKIAVHSTEEAREINRNWRQYYGV